MIDLVTTITDKAVRFLDIKLINVGDFSDLILRFGINFLMCYIIVHCVYRSKKQNFTFTYYTLSALVFLLCFLLGNVKLELGFALGLFAIFGIIRYRTSLISIKEMTYLFVVIGIAVVNALANKKVSWAELVFANAAIAGIMYFRERIIRPGLKEKDIKYDNVALLHTDKRQELFADLNSRLGINVENVTIGDIDYIKDAAQITIFYHEDENK
ncbi:MAG: DUF4956 domain-containing protein [Bacteroidetes bacterium]|nr:DUF4956 domain-containing protein [Bacteroidota bacterium]